MILVPGILIFIILYLRMKQRREEEKITNKWERLEIEIKKKLD
jgi:hypothetical protein